MPLINQSTSPYLAAQGQWPGRVSRIYFEALNTNTGKIYLGVKNMVIATMVNVIQTLPAPADATLSVVFADWNAFQGTNVYRLQDYWIDASVSGDSVICSCWVF